MKTENTVTEEIKDYPPYLDCPKPDSDEYIYGNMDDHQLCEELNKIWAEKAALEIKEKLIQQIRSSRYSQNNSFLEEINSTELSF